ncbi:unnamed protein product, partial [Closterium sp. NIES-53]
TLRWHHRLGHPSLPRLRGMHSRLLVSGLPSSLPSLPRSLAPPCLPCVDGRQRAAPHSSEFPPTTAPLQTLHMDVWGPALVGGMDQKRYFLLVVDDYTRYTTVFPLRCKADVSGVLIPWIRATCRQLRERFSRDFPQNGIAEGRIGLIMEVARTSMIHAATPHFLWPFAVRYAAHQLNLWPCVSEPETSTTLRWTGKVGDASLFRGPAPSSVSLVDPPPLVEPLEISSDSSIPAEGGDPAADDTAATRRSPRLETPPGFPPRPSSPPPQPAGVDSGAETAGAEPGGAETEDEGFGSAATGGVGSGGAATGGAVTGGADSGVPASPGGGGALGDPAGGPRAGQPPRPDLLETLSPQAICAWIVRRGSPGGGGYRPAGAGDSRPGGTAGAGGIGGTAGGASGAGGSRDAAGAGGAGATSPRGATSAGGGGPTSPGGTASTGGAGGVGGAAGAGGAEAGGTGGASTGGAGAADPGGARTRGVGAARAGGAAGAGGIGGATGATGTGGAGGTTGARGRGAAGASGVAGAGGTGGAGVAGAGGAVAAGAGGAGAAGFASRHLFFYPQSQSSMPLPDSVLRQTLSLLSSTGLTPALLSSLTNQSPPQLLLGSSLPAPALHTEVTKSLTESREPETRASTPVRARRVAHPCPPTVPGTHGMALRPSSVPQRVDLPKPPASSLPHVPDPESDLAHAASPTVTRLLATVITDPDLESSAAKSRLDYVVSLVTEQFELDCLAAALLCFASMLLCPEGDPDALDIPTPRSYAEAIAGEYSSQWQTAMDTEMASWKSSSTYVDEVPPPGVNIVDGMRIFRVKRPPDSPPVFKARYVA